MGTEETEATSTPLACLRDCSRSLAVTAKCSRRPDFSSTWI